jgi:hypothetical protein
MKTFNSTCVHCSSSFISHHKTAKYCSKICLKESFKLKFRGKGNPKWTGKIILQCSICSKDYERFPSQASSKFCSNKCKGIFQSGLKVSDETRRKISEKTQGKNNGNYGKKWNEHQKKSLSEKVKSAYENNPDYRYAVGKANRGKKFDEDKIERMHSKRLSESYSHPHTEETKAKLGAQSKERFNDTKYKENIIKKSLETKERLGQITKRENKSDWQYYWIEADWIKNQQIWHLDENGQEILQEFGIFNSSKNRNGVVRDHIVSRKFGFLHKIFPEILRHPANFQILTMRDNSKKTHIQNEESEIEKLFMNIIDFKHEWVEQDLCVSLIEKYKIGERWSK